MEADIRKNIPWQLWQLFFAAKPGLYAVAESHGLTILQMFALCLLEPDREVPMNSLSVTLHCDASNVTGIVDKLESLSLVGRQESNRDRRIKIIKPTAEGLALRSHLLEQMAGTSSPDMSRLSGEEGEILSQLLTKLLSS